MKIGFAAGTVAAFAPHGAAHAQAALRWTHFPAGETGFFRAPVLLEGATEAVLIDAGFSFPNGVQVARAIRATGKTLTTIYVSQSDPDYYFSLKPITEAFPEARVLAASDTIAAITASVAKKIETWSPQLGENGPRSKDDIVMPQAHDDPTLTVDGAEIRIVPAEGLANRRYLFIPSLNAVMGGVMIFAGTHVWTADTATPELRAAWVANLDAIIARAPAVVVPGHMVPGAATDLSAVEHTRSYLLAFEEELAKAADSEALKAAMLARYPDLGMGVALDVGAKVATGEMAWG